jgi:hypothetical protein|nr:MAG TPA: holin [Caudoviricetes sp.]
MFDLNNIPFDVYGVLGAILTAVATYVGVAAARFIKEKHLGTIVEAAVKYAEQKIGSDNGDQKFHLAANIIAEEAAKAHIKVDSTKLSNAIEPAVLKLNAELAQSYTDVPAVEKKVDTGETEAAEQPAQDTQVADTNIVKPLNASPTAAVDQKKVADMTLGELKQALK